MRKSWRRFELLLPRQFNDGKPVPPQWVAEAVLELAERFHGASQETQTIKGVWKHRGVVYRNKLNKLAVDVRDTTTNRKWMRQFKERWRVRLKQIELWMVSYRIEVE